MRIVEIEISNFRSLRSVKMPIDDLTILIGRNGAGKSSLLKALELFFTPNAKYSEEDFYNKDTREPIRIAIKFRLNNDKESEEFQKYVIEEEDGHKYIKVVKIMKFPASKSNQSYHGVVRDIPQFSNLPSRKDDLIKRYKELQEEFPDLPPLGSKPTKKKILEVLEKYKNLHPEKWEETLQEDQFFGYKEVGHGKIDKFIKFLLVPAVKSVSEEVEYKKGSIITELTQLIIEEHIRSIPEFSRLEKRYKHLLKSLEARRKTEKDRLFLELSNELTQILKKFAPNTQASISWDNLEDFRIPLPAPTVLVTEDGFETSVERVGHGTQRALLFSLLQYMVTKRYEFNNMKNVSEDPDKKNQKLTLLLVIEELELYQHPQRQKHLRKLFTNLAGNTFGGFNIQVMYSTHSPFLISTDTFDSLRLFKKVKTQKSSRLRETKIYRYPQQELQKDLKRYGIDSPSKHVKKFTTTVNPIINEGFFADKVVLVEGDSDRAALEVVAKHKGVDLDGNNISIIPVGGKGNMLTAYLMFNGFNIPTYPIWDLDRYSDEMNKKLFSVVQYKPKRVPTSSIVRKNFAVFNKNLEDIIKRDLGKKNWGVLFSKLKRDNLVISGKDLKNYAPMKRFIELWYYPTDDIKDRLIKSSDESLKTLEKIIEKIARL